MLEIKYLRNIRKGQIKVHCFEQQFGPKRYVTVKSEALCQSRNDAINIPTLTGRTRRTKLEFESFYRQF